MTSFVQAGVALTGMWLAAGCGANAAAAASTDVAMAPCSASKLAAFEPGSALRQREAQPPMEQRLAEQTEHVASVPCEQEESDQRCVGRARREVGAVLAEAMGPSHARLSFTTRIVREPGLFRAVVEVDGVRRELLAPTKPAFDQELAQLRRAHDVVVVQDPTPVSERAPRFANVLAVAPEEGRAFVLHRSRLVLEPPPDELAAMLKVHARATRQRIAILSYERAADGALHLELACRADGRSGDR